jgi:hypothetical protein
MTEEELVTLAIHKDSRARYKDLLKKPKQRRRLLDKLNHNPPLDSRYVKWFNTFQKALDSVSVEKSQLVRILSSADEIDGKVMPFGEAIEKTMSNGWGTILGVTPNFAIYYGEEGERGAVIQKDV